MWSLGGSSEWGELTKYPGTDVAFRIDNGIEVSGCVHASCIYGLFITTLSCSDSGSSSRAMVTGPAATDVISALRLSPFFAVYIKVAGCLESVLGSRAARGKWVLDALRRS